MAFDYQAVGSVVAAILGASGTVATGLYIGHNTRKKDESIARLSLEDAKFKRDQAEEEAGRLRIEQIVEDAKEARKARREMEQIYDKDTRELRADRQRGWDLARYYFGLVSVLAHLLNNLLMATDETPEASIRDAIRNAKKRMEIVTIPLTLEEPIPGPSMPSQPQGTRP